MQMSDAEWKHWLRGGFGFERSDFASHPSDRERALRMFYMCLAGGVPLAEVAAETERYLRSRGWTSASFTAEQVEDVLGFCKSIKVGERKTMAWLITWENLSEESALTDRIITIMDSRISSRRIAEFVEHHYLATLYSLRAKLDFATTPKNNPWRAEHRSHADDRVHCGESPQIFARIVKHLTVGLTEATWEELPDATPIRDCPRPII